jgi:hypothetical protein
MPRRSSWFLLLIVAWAGRAASAHAGSPYALVTVDDQVPAPPAAAGAAAAAAEVFGPPQGPRPGVRFRRCSPDDGPLTPPLLQATFARAQEPFFAGRFAETAAEIEPVLGGLLGGCRPLSAAVDAWRDPGAVGSLHDAGALLLAASRELGRLDAAEPIVRALLGPFAGERPTDGMFPPSLADRYLDLRPDETEVGWVVLDAGGCEANVAGRVAQGTVRVRPGDVAVGVRCPGGEPFVLSLPVARGASVRLAVPAVDETAAGSPAERTLLRIAATGASLEGLAIGVAVEAVGSAVRVAAWTPDAVRLWSGDAADQSLRAALLSLVPGPAPVVEEEPGYGAGPWLAAVLVAVGGSAAGAGAWALGEGEERRGLAEDAATAGENDRLSGEAEDLRTTGWALVGSGAAVAVAGLAWLIVELALGPDGEEPGSAPAPPIEPFVEAGAVGLEVSF